jgi:hypothetical protein
MASPRRSPLATPIGVPARTKQSPAAQSAVTMFSLQRGRA